MDGKNKSLLIVEDENSLRQALVDAFSENNFNIFQATDGIEALKICIERKPDVILADILMPGMDGLEFLKKLREQEWGKKIIVIILTNFNDPSKKEAALKYGAADFIVKSQLDLEDIIKRVDLWLSANKAV